GAALLWFLAACIAFAITWLLTVSPLPFGWFVVSVFACLDAAVHRRQPHAKRDSITTTGRTTDETSRRTGRAPAGTGKLDGHAPVAQLDRVLPSEGRGHRLESCRARHSCPRASAPLDIPAISGR